MKKLLFIATLLFPLCNFAQTEITLGTSSVERKPGPIYIASSTDSVMNSWYLSIFRQPELIGAGGYPGLITKLSWDKVDSASYLNSDATFEIYIKNTPYTEFSIAMSFANELEGATLVYSSNTQSLPATTGWLGFNLTTPFYWNGIDNIIVMTRWSRVGLASGEVNWNCSNLGWRCICYCRDETTNPPTSEFSYSVVRPNTKIQFNAQPINDAGVISLDSIRGKCSGNVGVYATIKNFGSAPIYSVQVNWDLDGLAQAPLLVTDTLQSLATKQVFLGNVTLSNVNAHSINSWTTIPNGVVDTNISNDSSTVNSIYSGLNGTYSIGSTGADFPSFTDAVSSLENNGVCGPTEFLFNPGIYAEKVILHKIPGASTVNDIVFRSFTSDSSNVSIESPSSASKESNYTLKLVGTEYVTFKSLTFTRTDTNSYTNIIELTHGPKHIKFLNNQFIGPKMMKNDPDGYCSGILNQGNVEWGNLTIRNNLFMNNLVGVWLNGSNESYADSIIAEENNFQTYYSGIYLFNVNSPTVNENVITRNDVLISHIYYGILMKNIGGGFKIQKNRITTNKGSIGISISSHDTAFADRAIIANNFIQCGPTWAGGGSGITLSIKTQKLDIFHNSINCNGSTASKCLQIDVPTVFANDIRILNNILSSSGGRYSLYVESGSINCITASDNNCLYSTGPNLAYYGSPMATLADLQSASGMDSLSVSANPNFVSINDLHTVSSVLSAAGSSIPGLSDDIDGDQRNLLNPDIGADEFTSVGIINNTFEKKYNVHPNPAHNVLIIEGFDKMSNVKITLIDVFGREVIVRSMNSKDDFIDVSVLSNGYYILRITSSNYCQIERMIKN